MKNIQVILIVLSLMIASGCSSLKNLSGNSNPVSTPYPTEDDYVPPQVGKFVRQSSPKSANLPANSFGNYAYSSPYAIPGEKAQLYFTYASFVNGKDSKKEPNNAKQWVDKITTDSFPDSEVGDCKDLDKEELSHSQFPHYKIIKRESIGDGELIVLQLDLNSLCSKESKGEKLEKVYFRKGEIVLRVEIVSSVSNYGNAEEFIKDYLKIKNW